MNAQTKLHPDSALITQLGGTFAVARMCEVRPPSVSGWRRTGIPRARRQYLQLLRPDVFGAPANDPQPAEVDRAA